MKSTFLTRAQISKKHFDCANLSDLMKAVEDDMQTRGEVVCQYVLNGMHLEESDERRLSSTPVSDIDILEIRSEKPTALLFDILQNWEIEIPRVIGKTDELATQLRIKGPEGRYTGFVNLIDSCQFLIESLVSMDSVVDVGQFLSREEWTRCEYQMGEAIGQALLAFEKKDYPLLGDVLEYDLANSLQSWFDLLKSLRTSLQEENDRDSGALTERLFKKSGEPQSNPVDLEAAPADGGET